MALITITSGIGCGEMAISRILADRLGLEIYDDRKIQEEAVSIGISPDDLTGIDEKVPGLLNRLLTMKPQTYLEVMESVVYKISGRDAAVILGHGAPFLLRDFGCALHARVYASESSRIETLATKQGISPDSARKLIRKSDNERKGFMQFAFHMDWDDPDLFDVIINREKFGTEGTAQLIEASVSVEGIRECSLGALNAMERLSLTKMVESAIIKNCLNPGHYHVSVPEKGIVVLTGLINPLESKDRLIEFVKAVPGVVDVTTALRSERIHDL